MSIREGISKIAICYTDENWIYIGKSSPAMDEILTCLKAEIEKIPAPLPSPEPLPNDVYYYRGFEQFRQDILKLLEEK